MYSTPLRKRELTPVRANVEELASKRPELRDVFLCHAWDDRQKAAKDLNDLLEARGVRVWFSEKDIGLGEPFMRSIDKIGQFARGNCVGDSRYAKHPP
ncbi:MULTISPECIES: toll/interleukin-1 receptor domain-containing protein [Aminobacter]|uniref:toll/interleukin-1 receptor domain-containing protein n=1 Tax=Aminobacter TaxID=31988 RepID=UPI0028B18FC7|nr:toll/interleukin-1 receptor domain-containing protein [Aminobacter aminovorans]